MIALQSFLELIEYTPKSIGEAVDGVVEVKFRDWKGYSAKIDFGTVEDERGRQTFRFEVLTPGREGVPDSRRKDADLRCNIFDKIASQIAGRVNDALSQMYRRN